MNQTVVFLSIPGLRSEDLDQMPHLKRLAAHGSQARLKHSFPAVTWPSQANMLTGKLPNEHGVIANGFYWRDQRKVEMWTAWNEKIESPQIWDALHGRTPRVASAVWFPMLSKGCGADYVCMPAPIHKPDGSEEIWCYTKPQEFYGELLEQYGHFPLQHFWGPIANIKSSQWIGQTSIQAATRFHPGFFYIYLPHLDYAAQKLGPNSDQARQAVGELDQLIKEMIDGFTLVYDGKPIEWFVASEYVITEVDHVTFPNRILRDAGLLKTIEHEDGEHIDFDASAAWAMVDHQFSHVFVKDADATIIEKVRKLFDRREGFEQVLAMNDRSKVSIDHERSGEVVLISPSHSWQAYYWWFDDAKAPGFARTVDIHRKPGYDPVELHFDPATRSIPLDATLIRGSHGAPVQSDSQKGVILSSVADAFPENELADTMVNPLILQRFSDDS